MDSESNLSRLTCRCLEGSLLFYLHENVLSSRERFIFTRTFSCTTVFESGLKKDLDIARHFARWQIHQLIAGHADESTAAATEVNNVTSVLNTSSHKFKLETSSS